MLEYVGMIDSSKSETGNSRLEIRVESDTHIANCRKGAGSKGVLRVPFVEPVTDRKGIKDAIVKLSKQIAAAKKAAE